METLIVILIIALLVQTGTYIYSHFFDVNANKANAATMNMLETAVETYGTNLKQMQKNIADRDDIIKDLRTSYDELVKQFNTVILHLPNERQKEAMQLMIDGKADEKTIACLTQYLHWVNQIKYKDNEDDNNV